MIQITKQALHLIEIGASTRRKASFGSQQDMVIQEIRMVVIKILDAVAGSTEIIGALMMASSYIKASNAGEIQATKVHSTPLAQDVPRFDDVVEGEHFVEIQATVAISI